MQMTRCFPGTVDEDVTGVSRVRGISRNSHPGWRAGREAQAGGGLSFPASCLCLSFHFQILPSWLLPSLYLVNTGKGSGTRRTHQGSSSILSASPETLQCILPPAARVQMAVRQGGGSGLQ